MIPPGPPRRGLDTKNPERKPFGAFCIKTAWQAGTRGFPSLGQRIRMVCVRLWPGLDIERVGAGEG